MREQGNGFRHEALFYDGLDEYAARASAFVRDGIDAGEPVLVAVPPEKIEHLRDALGPAAAAVEFRDMTDVGRNPLRIIPMWRDFVAGHAGNRVRGIGEPIWPSRRPEELAEAERHEALINLAFRSAEATILCPYDSETLDAAVLAGARRNHPVLVEGGRAVPSGDYTGLAAIEEPFDRPLPEPATAATELRFTGFEDLPAIRSAVGSFTAGCGLDRARAADLVLAVNEVATNSLRHGRSAGTVRLWLEDANVVAEVRDAGRADEPLIGRASRPDDPARGGFGLWIVNQLCDLVQIRSLPSGTAVRLHMSVAPGRRAAP